MKKIISTMFAMLAIFGLSAAPVFAHAVVKPSTAGVGSFTDFSLGVPSEKPVATIKVQLMIPSGLNFVTPIVKPGWKVDVKSAADPSGKLDDDGNPAQVVSEIDWSGGSVPAAQKDFFMFSGQVPAQAGELDWVVQQTYADGSVVSWSKTAADQPKDAKGNPDFSKFGPFSKTMVINDLKPSSAPSISNPNPVINGTGTTDNTALMVGGLALILSLVSLGMQMMHKKAGSTV